MKHIKKFKKFKLKESFDFETKFDIDEEVLTFVFSDVLNKYLHLTIKLVKVDNNNFKIELYDNEPTDENTNLKDEFNYIKSENIYKQIEAHFDSMDFKIKRFNYDVEKNIIYFIINQLV